MIRIGTEKKMLPMVTGVMLPNIAALKCEEETIFEIKAKAPLIDCALKKMNAKAARQKVTSIDKSSVTEGKALFFAAISTFILFLFNRSSGKK
jgi:hypothetical protein